MGRGRKGLKEQSHRKPKGTHGPRRRGAPIAYPIGQKMEIKKIPVPEHVVDFMKNMKPQQLVDFLCKKDDDWYVKPSSVNASGN